jgi:hypothetical protein
VEMTSAQIRATIRGELQWRKCPDCNGEGQEWWIEYALKERPHDALTRDCSAQEASDFCIDNWPDYDYGCIGHEECRLCEGIGYVANNMEDFE